jgi:hypothetical protein
MAGWVLPVTAGSLTATSGWSPLADASRSRAVGDDDGGVGEAVAHRVNGRGTAVAGRRRGDLEREQPGDAGWFVLSPRD